MKRLGGSTVLVVAMLLAFSMPAFAVPAFPGAEGYGRNSVGGRGGTVIQVTNLNDSGTGSLRAALTASGARTVVFRVAGIIEISSDILVTNPYLTVAGQTAPGDGICIKFSAAGTAFRGIQIATHDVVIRYLRIRCGFSAAAMDYGSPLQVYGTSSSNIILDHCSTSWHPGRTGVTIWPPHGISDTNITIQRHLAAEALQGGNYPNGARGAFLFGSQNNDNTAVIDHVTLYKSLMAHNRKRNPEAQNNNLTTIATYQIINNVIYDFRWDGSLIEGAENPPSDHCPDTEVAHYNVIGNYYKRSLISDPLHTELAITPGTRVYVGDHTYGNIGPNRTSSLQDPWDLVSFTNYGPNETHLHADKSPYQATSAFEAGSLPPYETATAAYSDVLADVGANMGLNADGTARNQQDLVDARLVKEAINNTGNMISSPADVGGWPTYGPGDGPYPDADADGMSDAWEMAKFGNLSRNGAGDYDGDGYTDLEEFLNCTDPLRGDSPPVAKALGTSSSEIMPSTATAPVTQTATPLPTTAR
jgi:pectate lyase